MRQFAIAVTLFIALLTSFAMRADTTVTEVGYYMAPVFIENATTIWTVRENPGLSKNFYLAFSTDYGTTWSTFGSQLPSDLAALPSSLFVQAGKIFIAEAPVPCKGARLFSVDRTTQQISVVRYLDPNATIRPWGWAVDGQGNLWAGQYGVRNSPPECRANSLNLSYILQIADASGNPVPETSQTYISRWPWMACGIPESCFGSWIAPPGTTADLHVHNLRYDAARSLFVINSGDSPRAFMTWNGNPSTPPTMAPRCCDSGYILPGFTGSAPLGDAVYVGDDWTLAVPFHRGNSIRKYPWIGSSLGLPTTVLTLSDSYDTPIFDLHASGELDLFFINYDEPREGQPSVRLSGLHRLHRTSPTANFPSTPETLHYYQSTWRNIWYIAADRNNQIPTNMPYIFIFSVGTYENQPVTVITRVSR